MRVLRIQGPSQAKVPRPGDLLLLEPSKGCQIYDGKNKRFHDLTYESILHLPENIDDLSLCVEAGSILYLVWLYTPANN